MALEGGILGRADDMLIVRGINIFPGAVDAVLGRFPEVAEFQVRVSRRQSLAELEVVIELSEAAAPRAAETLRRVETALHASFNLRIPLRLAPAGPLPRFEMKARRWVFE
jgi:phenylacetate-CoA ligase